MTTIYGSIEEVTTILVESGMLELGIVPVLKYLGGRAIVFYAARKEYSGHIYKDNLVITNDEVRFFTKAEKMVTIPIRYVGVHDYPLFQMDKTIFPSKKIVELGDLVLLFEKEGKINPEDYHLLLKMEASGITICGPHGLSVSYTNRKHSSNSLFKGLFEEDEVIIRETEIRVKELSEDLYKIEEKLDSIQERCDSIEKLTQEVVLRDMCRQRLHSEESRTQIRKQQLASLEQTK